MTFYELEKICKARKRRKIYFILFLLIILIGLILYLIYNKNRKINRKIKEINHINAKKVKNKEASNIKKVTKNKKNKFSLKFVLPEINETLSNKKEIKLEKNISKSKILESKTIPSFETCINLAKKYLKEKNYKEALKWAKFANIQNKKDPASWIISAKVLYKIGKKQEAIKLLKIYNKYYKNKSVQKLIKEFNK